MRDMELTAALRAVLHEAGADLVGVGDMSGIAACPFPRGVAVAVALPEDVVADLRTAPTQEYCRLYHALNEKLDRIVSAGEELLRRRGYRAWAQTTGRVEVSGEHLSPLPHKTVAVRAGLGWIGKSCLLVTPRYGSAVRLSSLLTEAPLVCDEPVLASRCGACRVCVDQCPAHALRGTLWEPGMPREQLVDAQRCYETQLRIMWEQTGIETDLCGKCFAVCPYTRRSGENGRE